MATQTVDSTKGRWVIVRKDNRIISALVQDRQVERFDISVFNRERQPVIGDIYVGKVSNIVPGIQAAFIEYLPGKNGYLDMRNYVGKPLTISMELPVQIQREAIKSKEPVLSANLQFSGKYVIVMHDNTGIGFSLKISDKKWKDEIRSALEEEFSVPEDCFTSVIVRTNAYEASVDEIVTEYRYLNEKMKKLVRQSSCNAAKTCIYQSIPAYCVSVRDTRTGGVSEVLTDDSEVYRNLEEYLDDRTKEGLAIRYIEPMQTEPSLDVIYGISRCLEKTLAKQVWLPSGGYLVIEPTEAMVVIDVNSGKALGRKKQTQESMFLKINMEAAREIARQLRLRNLSGMIMIDFIDMKKDESKAELMRVLREECNRDTTKTTVVDMTKLGIVEVTRKRTHPPLHEIIFEK